MIEVVSLIVSPDEACYGMTAGEDERGFYTRLQIVRADNLVSAEIRHGHDATYSGKIPPLFVPSPEGENPVGFMLELSEAHRHDLRPYNIAKRQLAESTLIADVIRQDEEARSAIKNKSSFGPQITRMRNGYSRQNFDRWWMDERANRTGKRSFVI